VLTTDEQKLNDAWEEHLRSEFNAHSADNAIAAMVLNPLVNQVPVMISGEGFEPDCVIRQSVRSFHAVRGKIGNSAHVCAFPST
jgi:hypothetical protein